VEVLAVTLPLQSLVEVLIRAALWQIFSDPKPTTSRMEFTFMLAQPGNPPGSRVVTTMLTQRVMDLIGQSQCKFRVAFISSRLRQAEKIAHRERVCPQVALRVIPGDKSRTLREIIHESNGLFSSWIRHVFALRLQACYH
jgi:hypothetical protein